MEKTKCADLRNLSREELANKERELKAELFKLNLERYGGRVEKPHKFLLIRKSIARVQTILNSKDKPKKD